MNVNNDSGNDGVRESFRAFISYSHADTKIARKIHRKLETYRLPAHLRQDGDQLNGRLGKIFRDREDLPAAQNLSDAVKAALAQSENLLVLCSPDARVSPWVAQEIELFRSLHPDRPILAAVLRGEPADAFPPLLLEGTEPLAADLRREADGWRLGMLKIIAGIAKVPLDALVQRDAQRRLLRVMAVTGGAFIALLVMIGMTIFAVHSRNEAQRQQAEAEGLVEYMLTDLRDELKGVGRLDVMTDVNERALGYYDNSPNLDDLPAESLERRARILHAMGEDDETRGELDKALAKFKVAHRVTKNLLARDPDNPDRIFGHAQSEYWIGRIAELQQNWQNALTQYQSYARLGERLIEIAPSNPDYMMENAWGNMNVGIIQLKTRTPPTYGQSKFESAIAWNRKALAASNENSAYLQELANGYAWLADSHFLQKNYSAALGARENELRIRQLWLDQNSRNSGAIFAVAKAEYAVAINLLLLHRKQQAISIFQSAAQKSARLVRLDPSNQEWKAVDQRIAIELKQEQSNASGRFR